MGGFGTRLCLTEGKQLKLEKGSRMAVMFGDLLF